MVASIQPLALYAVDSLVERISHTLFDDTFAGIHQLAWFDYAILIPYFVLLGILAIYGFHRYVTVYRYMRNKGKLPTVPAQRFEQLPRVTIQLPLYNERYVVERLLEAVSRIRYPRELLQIQVLDDSTDETRARALQVVTGLQATGVPIEYHHRADRAGYKAGALNEGLRTATGELIAMFDADFVPSPDFLEQTVDYFTDPELGMVQTRWTYLNREANLLTEVQGMLLDGHFILEQVGRCGSGLYFNFNGTAGVLRRRMIDDAGGWQHDTLTEDSDLSYRAQLRGWKFLYLPHVESPSELPEETYAFQVQQSRWAKGLTQVGVKLLPAIFRSPASLRHKLEAFFHLTPNVTYPLMVVVSALLVPVMIVRFYMGWQDMLILDLPVILATFFSIFAFYLAAQRERVPGDWRRYFFLMPMLIAAGVGLTVINTRAVLEAFFHVPTEFARTAKYAVAGKLRLRTGERSYSRRSGWLPFIELAFGSGFLAAVYFAIDTFNFLAVPFLTLFVGGYFWAGLSTLYQEYRLHPRWQQARAVRPETETSQ